MPSTIDQLTKDVLILSEGDRAHLAQTLLRSLDPTEDEGVEEAWDTEVARRLQRVQQGLAQGRPAEDVFRDLRMRHQA